jgi:hypothetical protein
VTDRLPLQRGRTFRGCASPATLRNYCGRSTQEFSLDAPCRGGVSRVGRSGHAITVGLKWFAKGLKIWLLVIANTFEELSSWLTRNTWLLSGKG